MAAGPELSTQTGGKQAMTQAGHTQLVQKATCLPKGEVMVGVRWGRLFQTQTASHLRLGPLPIVQPWHSGKLRSASAKKGILSLLSQWNQRQGHKNQQAGI